MYQKEYYEVTPLATETTEQRKPKEWKVYFDGNFYEGRGKGRAGTEISIEKKFSWNGNHWYIPAVYSCGKGLVIDLCIKVEPEVISAYYEKWGFAEDRQESFSKEERRQAALENPLEIDFRLKAEVNGKVLQNWSGSGICWTPEGCLLDDEENTDEAIAVIEHYHLDQTKGWTFRRISFPWLTKTKPALRTLALELEPEAIHVPGPKFVTPEAGESISFLHPITGTPHTLTVRDVQRERFPRDRFPMEEFEFPENFTQMIYILEPDIPKGEYTIKDVCNSDTPRRKVCVSGPAAYSVGIIGGEDGPTAVFLVEKGSTEKVQVAASALRFEPAETVEWELIFRRKPCEDIRVELLDENT